MQTLQVYIMDKSHYGNELYVIRLMYGNRTKNVLLKTSTPKFFDDIRLLFKTIAYMYKCGMAKYPTIIKTDRVMIYKVFKSLPLWQKNNWAVSQYTSKELFQKQIHQLDKLPKNYASIIPLLKRINKARTFFTSGIDILYINNSVRDNQFQMMKNFAINKAEQLPPTKAFHDANVKKLKQDSANQHVTCKMNFNIDSNLKNRFIKTLQDNNETSSQVLSKAIAEYVVEKGK